MTIGHHKPAVTTLALAISVALGIVATPAQAYESPVHVFSVDDVLGDFDGTTYGNTGATEDRSIICGEPSSDVQKCPDDAAQPIVDKKTGQELYPIDSEYGFYVVDFVGALEKVRDGDYGEGWIGNLIDGSGVAISNAITDRYKVKAAAGHLVPGSGWQLGEMLDRALHHNGARAELPRGDPVFLFRRGSRGFGHLVPGHPADARRSTEPVCRLRRAGPG